MGSGVEGAVTGLLLQRHFMGSGGEGAATGLLLRRRFMGSTGEGVGTGLLLLRRYMGSGGDGDLRCRATCLTSVADAAAQGTTTANFMLIKVKWGRRAGSGI